MSRKQKFAGLFAIIMVVSTLSAGLAVNSASAAIVFDDTRVTENAASQENPDIYEYGPIQNISIVYQDNRNGNWDIYLTHFGYNMLATPDIGSSGQGFGAVVIISAIVVVVAVIGVVAAVVYLKKRKR